MKIGKWSINFRWPWVIEDIQLRPEYGDYNHYGMFVKMIPSEAMPAGTAVMVAPDGMVSPAVDPDKSIGRAISGSFIGADGAHTVVIRLDGPKWRADNETGEVEELNDEDNH